MTTPTQPTAPRGNDSDRRWFPARHPALTVLLVGGLVLAAFHGSILRTVYGILVVDERTEGCRYAMIATPTPECFDAAAEMIADAKVKQILIVEGRPRRTVRVGAIPSNETLWKQDLFARGVIEDRIRTIHTQALTTHQMFRELDTVLDKEQNTNCCVISIATLSRYYRHTIDDALPPTQAARYKLHSVPPKASDASTWWRSRSGVQRIMGHGLRLAFVVLHGESHVDPEDPYQHLTAKPSSE